MPTIEYEYDGGKGKKSLYVPKLRVTFYIYEDPTKEFAKFCRLLRPICLSSSPGKSKTPITSTTVHKSNSRAPLYALRRKSDVFSTTCEQVALGLAGSPLPQADISRNSAAISLVVFITGR